MDRRYIFLISTVTGLTDLVNENMDDYEPVGGPVFFSETSTMGQAMVRRRTVKIDKPVWEYAGEINSEDVYRLVNTGRIKMKGVQ